MKNPNKIKMGKNSRAKGKAFELKVRHDLEKLGWIVCKWSNNVEFSVGLTTKVNEFGQLIPDGISITRLVPAKHTFNPFRKAMSAGNGFPDFICLKHWDTKDNSEWHVKLVESKITGKLDKIEKDKIEWIKTNLKIPVIIASKSEKRGVINYDEQ